MSSDIGGLKKVNGQHLHEVTIEFNSDYQALAFKAWLEEGGWESLAKAIHQQVVKNPGPYDYWLFAGSIEYFKKKYGI